jgi:hypothetical protein
MLPHNWRQESFEPAHLFQGMITCVQFYKCRLCGEIVGLPDHPSHRPPELGCTGVKEKVKVGWKHPIKDGKVYEKKTDYPAKRRKL